MAKYGFKVIARAPQFEKEDAFIKPFIEAHLKARIVGDDKVEIQLAHGFKAEVKVNDQATEITFPHAGASEIIDLYSDNGDDRDDEGFKEYDNIPIVVELLRRVNEWPMTIQLGRVVLRRRTALEYGLEDDNFEITLGLRCDKPYFRCNINSHRGGTLAISCDDQRLDEGHANILDAAGLANMFRRALVRLHHSREGLGPVTKKHVDMDAVAKLLDDAGVHE